MENIMDYEKAYKDALERARKIHNDTEFDYEKGMMEEIFPELKENEDEKMRKAIIESLPKYGYLPQTSIKVEDAIAWLEKQDKENNTYVINNTPNCGISVYNEELKESEDEKIRKHLISLVKNWDKGGIFSKYTSNPNDIKRILAWLEKQGEIFTKKDIDDAYLEGISVAKNELEKQSEQTVWTDNDYDKVKSIEYLLHELDNHNFDDWFNSLIPPYKEKEAESVDKAKPKFKVGDWIVNKGHSYLIADIDYLEHRYLFEIGGYTHEQLNWEYTELADKRYHLWTLEDAKDGDVLVSQYNKPFIYNGHYNEYKVGNHCGIECTGEQFIDTYNEICWTDNKSIKPATKEQRDLLFAKMHEAGYEWDKEKKELWRRFCESENYDGEDYGIDGLWHAKNILEETIGKVDGYQTDDGILEHKCAIAAVNKLYKQKPIWSEEDDEFITVAICFIDSYNHDNGFACNGIYKGDVSKWLKSLKERMGG